MATFRAVSVVAAHSAWVAAVTGQQASASANGNSSSSSSSSGGGGTSGSSSSSGGGGASGASSSGSTGPSTGRGTSLAAVCVRDRVHVYTLCHDPFLPPPLTADERKPKRNKKDKGQLRTDEFGNTVLDLPPPAVCVAWAEDLRGGAGPRQLWGSVALPAHFPHALPVGLPPSEAMPGFGRPPPLPASSSSTSSSSSASSSSSSGVGGSLTAVGSMHGLAGEELSACDLR